MTGIKLGQYVHGDTILHGLDPRTKIVCCMLMVAGVLLNPDWYMLAFYILLTLIAVIVAGMRMHLLWHSLRSIRYLLVVTFILQALLTPGEPLLQLGPLQVTASGLQIGCINLVRLLVLFFCSLVLLITTSPLKLAAGLESLLSPLSRLNIPLQDYIAILSISFRFIPTLIDEAVMLKNAQQSRGAQFDSPRLPVRLKSYLAILIPLFEASLARAGEVGEAMDSRCYNHSSNQLRLSRLRLQVMDITLMILLFIVSALAILASRW